MKMKFKKSLSILMVALMLFTMVPTSVFAAEWVEENNANYIDIKYGNMTKGELYTILKDKYGEPYIGKAIKGFYYGNKITNTTNSSDSSSAGLVHDKNYEVWKSEKGAQIYGNFYKEDQISKGSFTARHYWDYNVTFEGLDSYAADQLLVDGKNYDNNSKLYGADHTFTVKAVDGYNVSIEFDNTAVSLNDNDCTYNFSNKTAKTNITVKYIKAEAPKATVNLTVNGNGTVAGVESAQYPAGTVIEITATPDATNSTATANFVESIVVNGEAKTINYNNYVGKTSIALESGETYNIVVNFDEAKLAINNPLGDVAMNGNKLAATQVDDIKNSIISSVVDNVNSKNVDVSTVKVYLYHGKLIGDGATYDELNEFYASWFDDAQETVKVAIPATESTPELYVEGIKVKVVDSREIPVITNNCVDGFGFDTVDEIKNYITSNVSADKGSVTIAFDETSFDAVRTDIDGADQYVTFTASVASDDNYQGVSETYTLKVAGKIHKPTISFGSGITVTDKNGNNVTAGKVDAGEYTITITPSAGKYVNNIYLNDEPFSMSYDNYVDTAYIFNYTVENGDYNAEKEYKFTADYELREIFTKDGEFEISCDADADFDSLKDDIFAAVVDTDTTAGVGELSDVEIELVSGDISVNGSVLKVKITALATVDYPECSVEVDVTVRHNQVAPSFTIHDIADMVVTSKPSDDDIINHIASSISSSNTETEIRYEIKAFNAPSQGGSVEVTVKLSTPETSKFYAATATTRFNVVGAVKEAIVNAPVVTGNGSARIEKTENGYKLVVIPGDDSYIVSIGGDVLTKDDFNSRSFEHNFYAGNGAGMALDAAAPEYNTTVEFAKYDPVADNGTIEFNPKAEISDEFVAATEEAVKAALGVADLNATVKFYITGYNLINGYTEFGYAYNAAFRFGFGTGVDANGRDTEKIQVTIPENGKYPAVTKEVVITLADPRPEAVITNNCVDGFEFDTVDEIESYINKNVIADNGKISITNAGEIATNKDGENQTVKFTVTVDSSIDNRKTVKNFELTVKGKVHYSTVLFDKDVIDVYVNGVAVENGSEVPAGEIKVVVTPDKAYKYVDVASIKLNDNDADIIGNGIYNNGAYEFTYEVANGDKDAENQYVISATILERKIAVQNGDHAIMINPETDSFESIKNDIFNAVVDTANSIPGGNDFGIKVSDVEIDLAKGKFAVGEIKVNITWLASADGKYPEVTVEDVKVVLTDERIQSAITVHENNVAEYKYDTVDEFTTESVVAFITSNNIVTANVGNEAIKFEITEIPQLSEGESGKVSVKAYIEDSLTYIGSEITFEIPVYFNIQNSYIAVVDNGSTVAVNGVVADTHLVETGKYTIVATPAEGYAIEAIKVDGEIIAADYDNQNATVKVYLVAGYNYVVEVESVEAEFIFNEEREYGFKPGAESADESDIYDVAVKAPARADGSEIKVEYLAREEGTVLVESPSFSVGSLEIPGGTVEVPLPELWLEVGAEIVEVTLDDLIKDYKNATNIRYYGAHEFGANGNGSTEKIRVSYKDSKYLIGETETTVTIIDGRIATEIVADDNIEVTYGATEDEILSAIGATVVAEGVEIGAIVSTKNKLEGLDVGEYDIVLNYEGDNDYRPANKTVKLVVNKAPANVIVESQTVVFGSDFTVESVTDPAGINTIDFVIGVDVKDDLEGFVQVKLPGKLGQYFDGEMTLNEFKDALSAIANLGDELLDGLGFDSAIVNNLIDGLDSIAENLDLPNLRIKVNGDLKPSNIGVYIVGSVIADSNYETAADIGYLVIGPKAVEVELDWNVDIANGLISLPVVQKDGYDFEAAVVQNELSNEQYQLIENTVKYIFVGVNLDGEIVASKEAIAETGVYAELAYMINWGNELYYAKPIVRAFAIVPETANVEFVDENANNTFKFTYNGEGKGVEAVAYSADGKLLSSENITIHYYGMMNDGSTYDSTDAPVNAGAYTAVATYLEKDEQGAYIRFGMNVAAIAILPAESSVEVESQMFVYDDNKHSLNITTVPSNLDYILIMSGLKIDDEFVTVSDTVNIDFPESVDTILKKYIPDAYENGTKLTNVVATLENIEELLAIAGIENEELDLLISNLKTFSDDTVVTFKEQSEAAPSEVGAYMFAAIVCDPNHLPSIDDGLMTIVPAIEKTELYWNETDENGILTSEKAAEFDFGASAKADGVSVGTIFVGINSDDIIYLSREASTSIGSYTEVAYINDIDAEIYIAMPLIRSYIIVAEAYDVDLVDSNKNNIFYREYDGTPKAVEAIAYDMNGNVHSSGKMTITYVGVDGEREFYNSTEAPVNVGSYKIYATYIVRDDNGKLKGFGATSGILIIAPEDEVEHNGETEIRGAIEATCHSKGYTGDVYCLDCGEKIADGTETEIDANNHDGETEVRGAVTANCHEAGYTGDTYCLGCDAKIANGTETEIDANNHDGEEEIRNAVKATCHEAGYTGDKYCLGCGEIIEIGKEIAVDVGKHNGETEVRGAVTANCHTAGYTGDTYCLGCGEMIEAGEDNVLDADNHDGETEVRNAITANCHEAGYTGDTYCLGCGEIIEAGEEIAINDDKHDGETEVRGAVKATCQSKGYTGDTYCLGCDTKIADGLETEVDANNHVDIIALSAVAADCVNPGLTEGSVCGSCKVVLVEQIIVDALGHTEVIDAAVAATCTTTGLTEGSHCSVCNVVLVAQTEVGVLAHIDNDGDNNCDFGCGEKIYNGCKYCGKHKHVGLFDNIVCLIMIIFKLIKSLPLTDNNASNDTVFMSCMKMISKLAYDLFRNFNLKID